LKDIPLDPPSDGLVQVFAALGNPARFKILQILAERPEAIVADIVARLPLAQSTVSQHLSVLQEAGLIYDDRAGSGRCCRVNTDRLSSLAQEVVRWSHRVAVRSAAGSSRESGGCDP
jgi:ArsR family transcriptional regulator